MNDDLIREAFDMAKSNLAPVIRCKDCKHNNAEKALRKGGIWCEYWGIDPSPDDFCKRGERRADE